MNKKIKEEIKKAIERQFLIKKYDHDLNVETEIMEAIFFEKPHLQAFDLDIECEIRGRYKKGFYYFK